jgi:phycocyanobilin lyase beta subunit
MDPTEIPPAQAAVLDVLLSTLLDGEWVVRYSAISGIERMITYAQSGETRAAALDSLAQIATQDPDLAVRSRATLALDRARG